MNEKLNEALDQISDRHIAEATRRQKKGTVWLRLAAVAAAIAVLIGLFHFPKPTAVSAVSLVGACRVPMAPNRDDYADQEALRQAYEIWNAQNKVRQDTVNSALSRLEPFFLTTNTLFLSQTENTVWSPANAYIGLAMVAELSSGDSRQQILDLLQVEDMETLRKQVSAIWEITYAEGNEACALANSLWLQDGLEYHQQAMDDLSYHYYASVYQTDLQTAGGAISTWLDKNTGGLLKNYTANLSLPEDAVLALYSTLYFQSKWSDRFVSDNNTKDIFHAPDGDKTVTYMNKQQAMMNYYYSDCFGAVCMNLKNGSNMWFILPDEGYSPADILADGQYMQMLLSDSWENAKFLKVNLSVPKFDISCQNDLTEGLQQLGITDVFDIQKSDFSAITSELPLFLAGARQAARVQIDEEGVKAAAYMELPFPGSPPPPDEIVDFVLDRPFLFMITGSDVPLFCGVVSEP